MLVVGPRLKLRSGAAYRLNKVSKQALSMVTLLLAISTVEKIDTVKHQPRVRLEEWWL